MKAFDFDIQEVMLEDPAAQGEFAKVWGANQPKSGEVRLARSMIIQAVEDGDTEWFRTDLAQSMCEANAIDPVAVCQAMRRRRKGAA